MKANAKRKALRPRIDELSFESVPTPVREYEPMDAAKIRELIEAARGGCAASREEIVLRNQGLVHSLVKKFKFRGSLTYGDLIVEGNIGLLRAIESFDPAAGAWSTYAGFWINQKVRRSIETTSSLVRIPAHARKKAIRFFKAENEAGVGRLRAKDFAAVAGLRKDVAEKIAQAADALRMTHCIGEVKFVRCAKGTGRAITHFDDAPDSETLEELEAAMAVLDERERKVIHWRFFQGKKLKEVGYALGITRERVRQIEQEAIEKMREARGA